MYAVVMDDVYVGPGSIVGALSFLKAGSRWPERRIIAGNPAQEIGPVSDAMHAHKVEGTGIYQGLPADCHGALEEVDPLTEVPTERPESFPTFETWQQRRKGG